MKKLSLILILAAVILGVYGCENTTEPENQNISNKLETAFEGYDYILDIFQNNYDDNYYAVLCNNGEVQYNIFKSTDLGATWELENEITEEMFEPNELYMFTAPIFIYGKNDFLHFYLATKKYRKKKNASKFELVNTTIQLEDTSYFKEFSTEIVSSDKNGVLYSDWDLMSTDDGTTWIPINTPSDHLHIKTVYDNYVIYYTTSDMEYDYCYTSDMGETWFFTTQDYERNDEHSKFIKYYSNKFIVNDQEGKQIRKPKNEDFTILNITDNNTTIARSKDGFFKKNGDDRGLFSIVSSDNSGLTWDYRFLFTDQGFVVYYTKSGYIYYNSTDKYNLGIKRNKTPIK